MGRPILLSMTQLPPAIRRQMDRNAYTATQTLQTVREGEDPQTNATYRAIWALVWFLSAMSLAGCYASHESTTYVPGDPQGWEASDRGCWYVEAAYYGSAERLGCVVPMLSTCPYLDRPCEAYDSNYYRQAWEGAESCDELALWGWPSASYLTEAHCSDPYPIEVRR